MTIGMDARMLGSKQGGIGRYIEELMKAYRQDDEFSFVVFLRKENWDLVKETPKIKKVLADIPWYGWKEQIILPQILKKENVDLMHFPHWNIPVFYSKPFVVTIHDLLLLHYPSRQASTLGPIKYFFKNLAYRFVLKRAISKAEHIITPSKFTKDDIIKTFHLPAEKISAIHLAPAGLPNYEKNAAGDELKSEKNIFSKYNIAKPYVLYIGVAYPHKNLGGLLEAWQKFCSEHGDNYELVLAGRQNYFYKQLEDCYKTKILKDSNTLKSVIFTGFVPDNELPALYTNASLYVFPSFYEGFGLPALEAMQYHLPVVSSNAGSLPEVLGKAALYFNPNNTGEIASAILQGLKNENLREKLNKNSAQLIHNFSWLNTAKATLEVYKKML